MVNGQFIYPVKPQAKAIKYPRSQLAGRELLEKALKKKGLKIQLGNVLKGGFTSQVYEADLNGQPVVVKHVESLVPYDPTELYLDKKSHRVDSQVLKNLQNSKQVKVPRLLFYFPDITTSIMENVNLSGFELMQNEILEKKINLKVAVNVGKSMAELAKESRQWKKFPVVQTAKMSIYERGLELRLAYPNTQKEFLELEKTYLENNQYWSWPDGHPKNIFVNKQGEVVFIDFGYSQWADQRFMLPSHLAHIVIYSLAGYIQPDSAKHYLLDCVAAYKKFEAIDEALFCRYLAMEVFHRSMGKWVAGVESKEQKLALLKFGLTVFDEKITSIKDLVKPR